jgi:hypothetical protein
MARTRERVYRAWAVYYFESTKLAYISFVAYRRSKLKQRRVVIIPERRYRELLAAERRGSQ